MRQEPERTVYIRSRKHASSLRSQAIQHGLAALMLLWAGLGSLQSPGGDRPLAIFEILSGLLLFGAVVRELRAGHREIKESLSWVDLFAAVVLLAEGLHLAREGKHYVQYAYLAAALLMGVRSALHPWLLGLRRMELTATGLRIRATRFRRLVLPWSEILSAELSDYGIEFDTRSGMRRRVDLRDMINAAEVREAIEEALRKHAPGALGLPSPPGRPASPPEGPLPPRVGPRTSPRRLAVTREPGPALARCELTHLSRTPIDPERARSQHHAYEDCLRELGCTVLRLPADPDLPDSVFVEDTAIVLDELAILLRPGAESRRGEVEPIGRMLAPYRRVVSLEAPATCDGGDVLRLGRRLHVGQSRRTNREGLEQLRTLLAPFGYEVQAVPLGDCLHLKSAATLVAPDLLLVNPRWVDPSLFPGTTSIEVDGSEPFAANALRIGDGVIYPAAHARTAKLLRDRGIPLVTVDVSELAKAEGGVTCCSLIFEQSPAS